MYHDHMFMFQNITANQQHISNHQTIGHPTADYAHVTDRSIYNDTRHLTPQGQQQQHLPPSDSTATPPISAAISHLVNNDYGPPLPPINTVFSGYE